MGVKVLNIKNYKSYKKEFPYTYSFGAFATIEALHNKHDQLLIIVIDENFLEKEMVINLCIKRNIQYIFDNKFISRISPKENCYVIGILNKYQCKLEDTNHVALVNPSDMGNLGTIIRTMAAYNIFNLAIIAPAAEIMNPKVIRASMGAIFSINHKIYSSFDEYREEFKNHDFFPFILEGKTPLNFDLCPLSDKFSLIFGNEATGLPKTFNKIGQTIKIPQSEKVDSLNLSIATAIAIFTFASKNKLI